jgi:hypothetical protein
LRVTTSLSAAVLLAAGTACISATGARRSSDLQFVSSSPAPAEFEATDFRSGRWLKGNTHTHTLESDGDSPPDYVARWYKTHGYRFLVLSDHNVLVDPARFASLMDSSFLLIPGEEITTAFQKKPVHVNGLNIHQVIPPITDSTLLGTVQGSWRAPNIGYSMVNR